MNLQRLRRGFVSATQDATGDDMQKRKNLGELKPLAPLLGMTHQAEKP